MKQGTTLKAKQAFSMRMPGSRGRAVQVSAGDMFVVTTTTTWNASNLPKIMRQKNAMIGCGYPMSIATINQLFEEV